MLKSRLLASGLALALPITPVVAQQATPATVAPSTYPGTVLGTPRLGVDGSVLLGLGNKFVPLMNRAGDTPQGEYDFLPPPAVFDATNNAAFKNGVFVGMTAFCGYAGCVRDGSGKPTTNNGSELGIQLDTTGLAAAFSATALSFNVAAHSGYAPAGVTGVGETVGLGGTVWGYPGAGHIWGGAIDVGYDPSFSVVNAAPSWANGVETLTFPAGQFTASTIGQQWPVKVGVTLTNGEPSGGTPVTATIASTTIMTYPAMTNPDLPASVSVQAVPQQNAFMVGLEVDAYNGAFTMGAGNGYGTSFGLYLSGLTAFPLTAGLSISYPTATTDSPGANYGILINGPYTAGNAAVFDATNATNSYEAAGAHAGGSFNDVSTSRSILVGAGTYSGPAIDLTTATENAPFSSVMALKDGQSITTATLGNGFSHSPAGLWEHFYGNAIEQALYDNGDFSINRHLFSTGSAPALSGCGTSPSLSVGANDTHGTITEGTNAAGCTLTFAAARANTADCIVFAWNGGAPIQLFNATSAAFTFTTELNGSLGGQKYTYHCMGQ